MAIMQQIPMNFAPTGTVAPVPAEAFLTPQQRIEQAQKGGNAASPIPGGQGGDQGGGIMASIMKLLGMSGGMPM